ncbi:MAG: iron chelate uptake ABC transporter family permease subunit [Propionibacteriaceae bacterium]|nr:iron chelate uptake ABC transporter family permease subunit [Propionibacteriaceae bacterium]
MRQTTSTAGDATDNPRIPGGTTYRTPLLSLPLILGLLGVVGLAGISLLVGVYDVLDAADGSQFFSITRIPRTVSLLLAGAAMAMCGLVMQQLTQNRFVEPTTTGTTEWAGLGLLVVLIVMPEAPLMVKMVVAIAAAFTGTMLFFLVLRRITLRSAVIVPIIGIMLGAVVGAVSSYLALATNKLQTLGVWFQGSFSAAIQGQYEPVWAVLLVVVGVFLVADRFTVAGLGEDIATNVGLDYRKVVLLGTGMIAAATGIITVVIGNLPFLGLIVPNVVSMWRGDNLRSNLPWVCLLGAATITVCDIIGRVVIMPFEIPVGTILALLGSLVFVYLLLRRGNRG